MLDENLLRAVDRIHLMAHDECIVTPCQHSSMGESDGRIHIPGTMSSHFAPGSTLPPARLSCACHLSSRSPLALSPPPSSLPSAFTPSCPALRANLRDTRRLSHRRRGRTRTLTPNP